MNRLTDENGICVDCDFIGVCRSDCDNKKRYDKLKWYEDMQEQEKMIVFAYQLVRTQNCSKCGVQKFRISETWINPDLFDQEGFYRTYEEAEAALKEKECCDE